MTRGIAACFETITKIWDSDFLTYALARDAVCWLLKRIEAEGWSLLDGTNRAGSRVSCSEQESPDSRVGEDPGGS